MGKMFKSLIGLLLVLFIINTAICATKNNAAPKPYTTTNGIYNLKLNMKKDNGWLTINCAVLDLNNSPASLLVNCKGADVDDENGNICELPELFESNIGKISIMIPEELMSQKLSLTIKSNDANFKPVYFIYKNIK
jgi:hypothetical protein